MVILWLGSCILILDLRLKYMQTDVRITAMKGVSIRLNDYLKVTSPTHSDPLYLGLLFRPVLCANIVENKRSSASNECFI
jgi:hypothetical protein